MQKRAETLRAYLTEALTGREEGFVRDGRLQTRCPMICNLERSLLTGVSRSLPGYNLRRQRMRLSAASFFVLKDLG